MNKNNLLTKILIVLGFTFSISTFAHADRTANGVPGDGVIGYVLKSLGGSESIWVATSTLGFGSGGGISSPLTTKGDLWGFSTTDARVPVGTNGTVLTASSTATNGVVWSAISGSGTVTSVSLTTPTGLTGASTTCTSACILGISLTGGYVIPLIASTTEWATAFASTTALNTAYLRGLFSNSATGLTYTSSTGNTALTAGYTIPLTASTTEWATASASTTALTPSYFRGLFSATAPIIYNSVTGVFSSGLSTTTVNTFSAQNNFTTASATAVTVGNLFATSTIVFTGTSTQATTTITNLSVSGQTNLAFASSTSVSTGNFYATGTVSVATTTINGDLTIRGSFIPRVTGYASNASTTFDLSTIGDGGVASTTIFATSTIVNPTGTYLNGMMFEMWLKATTTAYYMYWGTNFASSTNFALPTRTASGTMKVLMEYRQDSGKLECANVDYYAN